MITRPIGRQPISNGTIVRYAGGLAVGMTLVLGYSALVADGRLTIAAAVLLMGVAAYALVFYLRQRHLLRLRAYASLTVHATTYLIVLVPLWVYAGVSEPSGGEATASDWAAALTAMTVGWGIGLAVHAFGAVHTRGFDDVAAA